jgi:hypothetical protein
MLAAARNTGTAVVSRFCNGVGQTQREPGTGAGLAPGLDVTPEQPRILAGDRKTETAARPRP